MGTSAITSLECATLGPLALAVRRWTVTTCLALQTRAPFEDGTRHCPRTPSSPRSSEAVANVQRRKFAVSSLRASSVEICTCDHLSKKSQEILILSVRI